MPAFWRATKPTPPPPPPPTQCYPLYSLYSLYSFYSPPHSTIRQRINCRSASFFGSCFATAVPHLSGVTTHDTVPQAIGAVFFRRSRLFFREAAFFSGGEGCEWGAKQPTVGESGDKAENEFSGFIPLIVPRKGFSPHISASRLFVLFHPSNAYKAHHPTQPHQIKQPLSKIAVNERTVGAVRNYSRRKCLDMDKI